MISFWESLGSMSLKVIILYSLSFQGVVNLVKKNVYLGL